MRTEDVAKIVSGINNRRELDITRKSLRIITHDHVVFDENGDSHHAEARIKLTKEVIDAIKKAIISELKGQHEYGSTVIDVEALINQGEYFTKERCKLVVEYNDAVNSMIISVKERHDANGSNYVSMTLPQRYISGFILSTNIKIKRTIDAYQKALTILAIAEADLG